MRIWSLKLENVTKSLFKINEMKSFRFIFFNYSKKNFSSRLPAFVMFLRKTHLGCCEGKARLLHPLRLLSKRCCCEIDLILVIITVVLSPRPASTIAACLHLVFAHSMGSFKNSDCTFKWSRSLSPRIPFILRPKTNILSILQDRENSLENHFNPL